MREIGAYLPGVFEEVRDISLALRLISRYLSFIQNLGLHSQDIEVMNLFQMNVFQVVKVENAYTLTYDSGLHLKATKNCVDAQGKKR